MTSRLGGVALAAAVLLGAGAASAQPAAPAPADPERLALAQRIYAMMGDQTLQSLTKAMKGMLATSLQGAAGADPARMQAIQAALSDSLDDMMPKVIRATAQIMAQDFSADELRGMLAFYQSPTGQAVLHRMPEITQQSVQVSLSLLPGFMQRFERDYCGRITCTPKENQAFAQLNARLVQDRPAAAP